ncbi:MAG TPA: trypsin-like peptidase domain-containing protein [Bryobacteraceae bacterium]|jgi:serine protease Do
MNLFDKMRQQKLMSVTLMVFTLSVGILIGTLVNTQVNAARGQNAAPDATPLTVPKAVEAGNEFSKIAKKLQPSVVNVIVEVAAKPQATSGNRRAPSPDDEGDGSLGPLGGLFGLGPNGPEIVPQGPQKHEQSGTGFVVDRNGYIVTNNHVIEGGDKITVKMYGDSTEYRARVIGTDYETDLAVLKIDAHRPLETVSVGNSDAVQVGDWAIAIGSPFTLEESVTLGIVSALGRGQDQVDGARSFQHFIQTDAAINPGNSGGPLVNIRGEVIGVNTMIATSRGGSEGVGFALPSNTIVRVYNDVIKDGEVSRGSIGVSFLPKQKQKPEMLKGLGVDHGVIVTVVAKGGPSEKAGLKPNDIIMAVNGQAIKDSDDLMSHVADAPVGSNLTLTVDRDGKRNDFKVVTEDRKKLYADHPEIVGENYIAPDSPKAETTSVKLGIRPRELTDDERSKVPEKRGVYVSNVEADSFAADIELREGEIITAINRKPVNSVDDVRKIMASLKSGDAVAINVVHLPEAAAARGRGQRAAQVPAEPESTILAGTLP